MTLKETPTFYISSSSDSVFPKDVSKRERERNEWVSLETDSPILCTFNPLVTIVIWYVPCKVSNEREGSNQKEGRKRMRWGSQWHILFNLMSLEERRRIISREKTLNKSSRTSSSMERRSSLQRKRSNYRLSSSSGHLHSMALYVLESIFPVIWNPIIIFLEISSILCVSHSSRSYFTFSSSFFSIQNLLRYKK